MSYKVCTKRIEKIMAREEQSKRRKVTGSLSGPDTPAAVVANVGAAATAGTTGTPVAEQGEGGQADLSSEDLAKRNAEIAAEKERKKQVAEKTPQFSKTSC